VPQNYEAATVSIASGGTGYAVNNVVQVTAGEGYPTLLTVTSVSGGVVTGLAIANPGSYVSVNTSTLSTVSEGGATGSGLTVSLTFIQTYVLWQHETGSDSVYLTQVDAVYSAFETPNLGWVTGGPGNPQLAGDNRWAWLERVEPDFIQVGQMDMIVTGKGYADDTDEPSDPYTFDPTTLKIDLREQRREMRLRFESNTQNGNYQMGRILLSVDQGDQRGTGNP
jgi:hypothetical protein